MAQSCPWWPESKLMVWDRGTWRQRDPDEQDRAVAGHGLSATIEGLCSILEQLVVGV